MNDIFPNEEPTYTISELYKMVAPNPNSNENQIATMYIDWECEFGEPVPKLVLLELPCGCVHAVDVTEEGKNVFDEMISIVVSLNVMIDDEEPIQARFLRLDDSCKLFVIACALWNEDELPNGALNMNPFELVDKIVENNKSQDGEL